MACYPYIHLHNDTALRIHITLSPLREENKSSQNTNVDTANTPIHEKKIHIPWDFQLHHALISLKKSNHYLKTLIERKISILSRISFFGNLPFDSNNSSSA